MSQPEAVKQEPSPHQKIYVDLDGTLADYSKGWQGEDIIGDPILGAVMAMSMLRSAGYEVWIWTVRKNKDVVREWIKEHGIPVNGVYEGDGKPIDAMLFVDDRCVRFNGCWADTLDDIFMFQPWHERVIEEIQWIAMWYKTAKGSDEDPGKAKRKKNYERRLQSNDI